MNGNNNTTTIKDDSALSTSNGGNNCGTDNNDTDDAIGVINGGCVDDDSVLSDSLSRTRLSATSDQLSLGGSQISNLTEVSAGGTARKLSPLGIVVKKCSKELQAKPPLSEKRSLLILQSLLNVLETKQSTISPAVGTSSIMLQTAEDKEAASVMSHRKQSKLIAIENGALSAITHTMKLYKDSPKLQSKAVLLLGTIGDEYPKHIGDCYAVSYITATLIHSKHCKSDTLCLDCVSSLVKICGCSDVIFDELTPPSLDHQRNISQLAHGDGVKTLRQIMKLHIKRDGIQQYSLQLLCSIANMDTSDVEAHGAAGGGGGPGATTATGGASVMSSGNSSSGNRSSKRSLMSGGISCHTIATTVIEDPELIEILVAVLSKHKKHKYVQQFGVTLLYLLATKGSSRTKSSLVWSNSHLSILKAMSTHPLLQTIQLEGCEALYAMALERPEARSSIAEEGSATILESMKTHPNHSPINQSACQLLALLCGHPTTSKFIAKAIDKQPHYRSVLSWAQAGHKEDTNCNELVSKILKSYDEHCGD